MKKIFLIISLLLVCLTNNLFAVVAYPHPINYTQSDNTQLTLSLRGDEKVSWGKTTDDYTLMRAKNGDWVYAIPNGNGGMQPSGMIAHNPNQRTAEENAFLANLDKGLFYSEEQISYLKQLWDINDDFQTRTKAAIGSDTAQAVLETYKMVVILMSYNNYPFTTPKQEIENLFNQVGYSSNGHQGSVHDYFTATSFGKLNVEATVVGPYTTAFDLGYYGENYSGGGDMRARELIAEAVDSADLEINFAEYTNGPGSYVSCVYVIYAGFAESSGGAANTIWPHRSAVYPPIEKDGVNIFDYACSSEKNGTEYYPEPLVIGTICHEFSHVLGLPDFYDTDYSENGSFSHHESWDLMCSGNYNNGGKCPPIWNAYQRATRNYTTIEELTIQGNVTLQPLITDNVAYKLSFSTNEYFILENRQQIYWDKYLPGHGMLIFHVNKNASGWSNHCINCNPNNPGFDLEEANGSGWSVSSASNPFPGTANKTEFSDTSTPNSNSFQGVPLNRPIMNITENTTTKNINFVYGPINSNRPTVLTTNVDAIEDTIEVGLTVNNFNSNIVETGICYSTTNVLPTEDNDAKITTTTPQSTALLSITSLSPDTEYYVRAYAKTSSEIGYGEVIKVKTLCSAINDFPYHESFEDLSSLICWSQETDEYIDNAWVIIDSAYTSGAIATPKEGNSWAVIKSDRTSGTQKTTLVSSPIDVKMLEQPVLSFSHTQKIKNNKKDALKVKYKTSARDAWHELVSYTAAVNTWADEIVNLPSNQDFIILGFEAEVKGGYGVTLDDVKIYDGDQTAYPQVQTISVTSVTDERATVSAKLDSHGNNNVHTLGICLATHPLPTIEDSVILTNTINQEIFTINLLNLVPNTTYYVRAFARNNGHIDYGDTLSFVTECAKIEDYPFYVNVPEIQSCLDINTSWNYDSETSIYTFTSQQQSATAKLVLPILNMADREATYISFDRKQLTQGASTDVLKVLYKNDISNDWQELITYNEATTDFQRDSILLTNLSSNYYLAFEGMSNLSSIELKDIVVYATYQLPILEIEEVTSTHNSISLAADVIYEGVSPVTDRGFCWGTTPDIDVNTPTTIHLGTGMGEISTTINNLQENTVYYVRAFATNNNGTSYTYPREIRTQHTPIFNNTIGDDQTICEGTVANILVGSVPTGGDGVNYTYKWIMSTDMQTWSDANIGSDYTAQSLDMRQLFDTTYFRRVVYSTYVSDTSNMVTINVHSATQAGNVFVMTNTIPLGESVELQLRASKGTVLHWEYKKPEFNWLKIDGTEEIKIINHQPDQMGTWKYRVIVQNGVCPAKTSGEGTVNVTEGVGLDDLSQQLTNIKLLPNPSNGKVKLAITTPTNQNVTIEVYDMQSRKVYVQENVTLHSLSQTTLDLTHLTNGTYLIKLTSSDNFEWTEKLIIYK